MGGLIAEPAGLRVLSSLIDLVTDKNEVAKVIKAINEARDEANEAIKVVGTIKQIDALSRDASEDRATATVELTKAKVKAKGIVSKGEADAAALIEGNQVIVNVANARGQELNRREIAVSAREKELQKTMDSAGRKLKTAEKLKDQADALTIEAERQLEIFRSATSQAQ